jgi:hypothetical protein
MGPTTLGLGAYQTHVLLAQHIVASKNNGFYNSSVSCSLESENELDSYHLDLSYYQAKIDEVS